MIAIELDEADLPTRTLIVTAGIQKEHLEERPLRVPLLNRPYGTLSPLEAMPGRVRYRLHLEAAGPQEWPQFYPQITPRWGVIPAWCLLAGTHDDNVIAVRTGRQLAAADDVPNTV